MKNLKAFGALTVLLLFVGAVSGCDNICGSGGHNHVYEYNWLTGQCDRVNTGIRWE